MLRKGSHKRVISMMLIVILFGFTAGYWYYGRTVATQNMEHVARYAHVLPTPRLITDFDLVDDHGQSYTRKQLTGHWSFLFFGFSRCPKICPTILSTLQQTDEWLSHVKVKKMPATIMVSIDPQHDSSSVLRHYVQQFGEHVIGLTGDQQQIKALAKDLGIAYHAHSEKHQLSHSQTIVLIDDKARIRALFMAPHHVAQLANGYTAMLTYG